MASSSSFDADVATAAAERLSVTLDAQTGRKLAASVEVFVRASPDLEARRRLWDGECHLSGEACPVGSNCSFAGIAFERLPLLRGYYRRSNTSGDLRRCPDFGAASGCVGGVSDVSGVNGVSGARGATSGGGVGLR